MDEMENQLGAILGNPEMMQKIMSLAQSMQSSPPAPQPPPEPSLHDSSALDLGMVQKISGLLRQSGVDQNQQNLLHALAPYLSQMRIQKLERAMRAARMATAAGSFFGNGRFFSGR